MRPTVKGKRVRCFEITMLVDMDQGAAASTYVAKGWKAPDDYRLIGAELLANGEVDSAGAYDEGDWQLQAYFTRDGTSVPADRADKAIDGDILGILVGEAYHEETFGVGMNGRKQDHVEVMFPDGHGIDVEEGEQLFVSAQGINRLGAGAGDMTGNVRVLMYFVEI